MRIELRPFTEADIPDKVRWINDPSNHAYLHYDLPLTEEGTGRWFRRVKDDPSRLDCVITADGVPCGVIGLLRIDPARRDAEFYITVGEAALKRKGIAFEASRQLLSHAFRTLGLASVYLYTETENRPAQNLFGKLGFEKDPGAFPDVYPNGKPACRFAICGPERER